MYLMEMGQSTGNRYALYAMPFFPEKSILISKKEKRFGKAK
jgi:hypothetical protein